MNKWLLLLLLVSPVSGKDGIDALRALLQSHKSIPAVTATILSSKFVIDRGDPTKLTNGGESKINAIFGASSEVDSRYDFNPLQLRWLGGPAPFKEKKISYVFGDGYWAKLIDREGPIGMVKAKKYAEIRFQPSLDDEINQWEAGDGFLLLRQKVFDTVSILDLEKLSKVTIQSKEEDGLLKIVFERDHKGSTERDEFIVSPGKGYALIERRYERRYRKDLGNAPPAVKRLEGLLNGQLIVQVKTLQQCGEGFLPVDSVIDGATGNGRPYSRIDSKILKWELFDGDLPLSVPSGYRVNDLRSGAFYKVGPEGPKLIEKIEVPG